MSFPCVEYSYVHDFTHRDFDLVDGRETTRPGSHAELLGNIIVKNPQSTGNRAVIHFGQDGGREHDCTLYHWAESPRTEFGQPDLGAHEFPRSRSN